MVGSVKDLHKGVNKVIHLRNCEDIEVLMDVEEFELVVFGAQFKTVNQYVHDLIINIKRSEEP